MQVRVEIETDEPGLARELLEVKDSKISGGMKKQLSHEVVVRLDGFRLTEEGPEEALNTVKLLVDFNTKVGANLLANWIIKRVEGRRASLKIEGLDCRLEEGEITRILMGKLEVQ